MKNYRLIAGILIVIVVILLTVIFQLLGRFDIMESFSDIWILIAAILLGIASNLITGAVKKKYSLDLSHLVVHYSSRNDMPNKPNTSRPRYVINNETKEAYWVSTPIHDLLSKGKIQWHTHDNEKALHNYLRENDIHLNNRDGMFKELGMKSDS